MDDPKQNEFLALAIPRLSQGSAPMRFGYAMGPSSKRSLLCACRDPLIHHEVR